MAWTDRLKKAAYTGAVNGVRVEFAFENVSKTVTKRTTAFDFPDLDGTYIQDLGYQGRRYPMRAFFWGPDHDLQADEFESVLLEQGTGRLEHPFYGTFSVVPFGTITRRDDLTSQANQSIVEVTFYETVGISLPTPQQDPQSTVIAAVEKAKIDIGENFKNKVDLQSVTEQVASQNNLKAILDQVRTILQPIADTADEIRTQFNTIYDSINNSLDILVGEPLALALQVIELVQIPGRAAASISEKLKAYGDTIDGIIALFDNSGDPPQPNTQGSRQAANNFEIASLFASSAVTGSVISTVFTEFENKPDAISSAEVIVTQSESVTNWQDETRTFLEIVDSGEAYQQRQEAVAIGAGFLVEISFTLRQERIIFISKPRTIIDLCSEVYGTVDDADLDRLINNNNLSGSEILEIPTGREIAYYV